MQKIEIKCNCVENYHIDDFIELQGMLKTMSSESYEMLKNSIIRFGFRFPIFYVLLEKKKYVLDGHGRLFAIKRMIADGFVFGDDNKLPAVRIDASSRKEAKEILLALNSKYGEMTTHGLRDFLDDVGINIADVEHFFKPTEFTIEEFNEDFTAPETVEDFVSTGTEENSTDEEDTDTEENAEKIPEVKIPVMAKGDIIKLGQHRLMCGNSQDGLDVSLLMDGEKISMVFTDPPYNYAEKNKLVGSDTSKAMQGLKDAKWDVGFDANLFLNVAKEFFKPDITIYVCTSHHLAPQIWEWMSKWADFYSYCVFSKINPMPSLMKRHWTWDSELVCYATKGKHTFNFPEEGHAPSTWRMNKSQCNDLHPTQKPIHVPAHAVLHSSKEGDIVVDFFGGSGSTLIACHQNKRICYTMEISEVYCQVIIERYVSAVGSSKININGKDIDWYEYKASKELLWQKEKK